MITYTIREIVNSDDPDEPEADIYIVRDGETIFYIGMSRRGIAGRMFDHLGMTTRSPLPDALGVLVKANAPASGGWLVDLLTAQECEPIVKQVFPEKVSFGVETAETALIIHHQPCINVKNNRNPKSLPKQYLGVMQDLNDAPCDHLGLK